MENKKTSFSGKLGFVLATAGSAVGLGNIWRFPYLAAKQGGGIFVLTYLLMVVFVGIFLCMTEIAIGRKTGKSTLDAFGALSKKWGWIGYIPAIVPVIIIPYYSVVGGWVIKYASAFLFGSAKATVDTNYFNSFISSTTSPILCFSIYFLLTCLIVSLGVEKGIEKVSKVLMPILVVLCISIAIYTLTLPGAFDGVKYLFVPNFSQFSIKTVFAAMSQMFYSLSLSMGILITYGTYMKKEVALDKAVKQVAVFDTGFALVAALMVVPSVFVFSHGDPSVLNKGAGLMFVTLPKVFDSIPGGTILGILFFILVFFAALTSSIALMEAVVNQLQDRMKWSRGKSCLVIAIYGMVVGILVSLGFGKLDFVKILNFNIFDFCDFISNNVLMPIGALLICIFAAYIIKPKTIIDEVNTSSKFGSAKLYTIIVKYVAPVIIFVVFITSVLEGFGLIKY